MRLDLYLKSARLVTRRTVARQFCDAGRVRVNGEPAKPSKEVKAGDVIEIRRRDRRTTMRVVAVPATKQVSRAAAGSFYEVIGEERFDELFS